ncbi:flagellar basal-body rod protein FlgG [Anaerotignum neopropionicum]|uniref:Flagellar basal-body rod protein FlgG n=1 Tax=Anaerotignum neopropionicum TaxID=36847 RepID=A0A136WJA7_9FIRM|nr:flagellar hook-basal body complex protein [Anaerotignum neopropionicum]KXL54554.1 flagellar basal-body rod protein FlgG [Anaerotignum neopropionicum]
MYKGFYNLSSSMLTQNKNLNVISNNLANVSTSGYKSDRMVSGTFKDQVVSRTGNNILGAVGEPLGNSSMITVPYETVTDFTDGGWEQTGSILDFAINGRGFFEVDRQGEKVYTRNGSLSLDEEGYVVLQGIGRVNGDAGPIKITTDDFNVSPDGRIYDTSGDLIAKLKLVDFNNYDDLTKVAEGVFTGGEAQATDATVMWKHVEASNVNPVQEMTDMLVTQRTLQSAAQVLKMYDAMAAKAADIGRVQ